MSASTGLGQPVDLVVEEQDLHIDIAAEGVDQMVATDGEGVTVTGDHPHREVGPVATIPEAMAARPWMECIP